MPISGHHANSAGVGCPKNPESTISYLRHQTHVERRPCAKTKKLTTAHFYDSLFSLVVFTLLSFTGFPALHFQPEETAVSIATSLHFFAERVDALAHRAAREVVDVLQP